MPEFVRAAIIRAVRTAAQTALAGIGTVVAFDQVPWAAVGTSVALASVVSLLTSIATGLPEVEE